MEHNKRLLKKLEVGDLVEFPGSVYSHWAVYVGNGKIIHLTGDFKSGSRATSASDLTLKGYVTESDFLEEAGNCEARINNTLDDTYEPLLKKEILKRAKDALGKTGYHVLEKNCEHFATWCRYGVATSKQAEEFLKKMELTSLVPSVSGPGALAGAASTSALTKKTLQ